MLGQMNLKSITLHICSNGHRLCLEAKQNEQNNTLWVEHS